jgi:hypothetical protein
MNEASRGKEPYEKPSLKILNLMAEEVLAVGCKNVGLPAAAGPSPPCMIQGCAQNGS